MIDCSLGTVDAKSIYAYKQGARNPKPPSEMNVKGEVSPQRDMQCERCVNTPDPMLDQTKRKNTCRSIALISEPTI